MTRRDLLKAGAGAALAGLAGDGLLGRAWSAETAPTAPVSLTRCYTYDIPTLANNLYWMFDRIGGIRRLVSGKTCAVKLNLTGSVPGYFRGLPGSRTFQTHPNVAYALAALLRHAGARRIRFLESGYSQRPFFESLPDAGWDLRALEAVGGNVEFEDTRNLGRGSRYSTLRVPWGGYVYPHYLLNHSYEDTDVFISLPKMKNHDLAGVTLSLKNSFGITPTSLYGDDSGSENATANRVATLHEGRRKPPAGVPEEVDPRAPDDPTWRIPHIVADLCGARPIDLAVIDGIESVKGGEGPWNDTVSTIRPGVLIAGRNPVCTDAVAMAAMGYFPMVPHGVRPFPGHNHLTLAAEAGIGTNNLTRIEVIGPYTRVPFGHYRGR